MPAIEERQKGQDFMRGLLIALAQKLRTQALQRINVDKVNIFLRLNRMKLRFRRDGLNAARSESSRQVDTATE